MKICVYTIAKNEEKFVKRWAKSCEEADYRVICDTGSSDETIAEATSYGVSTFQKEFTPWRFDHARNWSLECVPKDADVCISLDMDEVLVPGWREALEKMSNETTRPRYKYVWSWNEDGSEGLVYGGDKIHSRSGYKWVHPVHEVLIPTGEEKQSWIEGLEIRHYPDHKKSRSQYLPLLEIAVQEMPDNDRNQFYLAREYFFNGMNELSSTHFKKHLELSKWPAERAASCRYLSKIEATSKEKWLYRAIAEDSSRRESWVELSQHFYEMNDWEPCRFASIMSLRIREKQLDYLCEPDAWGWKPHDLLAISSYWLGDYKTAFEHGKIALSHDTGSKRLISNLKFYESKLNEC